MKDEIKTHLRYPVWEKKAKELDLPWREKRQIILMMAEEYRAGQEIEKEMQKAKRDSRDEN